ncbi:sialidase family protein [Actinomadura montaniterrae]|uniref:Exo-alpha-sialidase n=1 Tax=Actinomadura montaniterrae TaxID=1803903 RepID=A0A6L3VI60_9ACTN|nr:sialidase family protein [Actinomadura montaniterrae]KAB2370449.1 exo-alpha-sialidase [Actinomadura montaniterrae]
MRVRAADGEGPQASGEGLQASAEGALVFDRPQGAPTPPEGGGTRVFRPGLRSGIAVAAVAVLVAGGVTYLVRDGGKGGGHGDAPGAEAADKVFAVPAALYDGHQQTITAVAVHGDTAVTVGSETVDAPRGQILVSSDGGKAWSTAKVKDEGGTGQDVPEVVAAGDRAWAALGRGPGGVAVWTSADGRTWTHRAPGTGAFNAGDQVTGVAATSAGFAAVGTNQGAAVLWTSPDGVAWQRQQAGLQGKPVSIAASGATLVVRNDKGDLWRSADGGRTWARAEVPQSDGSYGPVVALTAGPGGFFAAREGRRTGGSSKNPKKRALAVFFRSSDGVGWTRSSTIDRRTYSSLAALGGSDAGLAALTPLSDGRVAAQRSKDGVNWESVERLGTDQGREAGAAAALPQGVLLAGHQNSGAYLAAPGARHGDIDLLSIPGAVTPDRTIRRLVSGNGVTLAVGSGAGEAAVWTTRDGKAWTRAGGTGLTGPGVQRLAGAAFGPKGWVAAGRSAAKPLLLTSADANAWNPVAGPSGDDGELAGAAYGQAGYVVVGSTGKAPIAWRSDDLAQWTAGSGDLQDGKMHDVAAVTKGYVAVGERNGAPAVWTSDDGAKWTSGQAPQAQGPLTRVVARGDTLVATGAGNAVAVSSDAGRTWRAQTVQASALVASVATPKGFVLAGTPAGTDDVALWSSPDGAAWRMTRPRGARLAGDGSQRLTGLAALGQGLVATGMDGDTPTLWRTALP